MSDNSNKCNYNEHLWKIRRRIVNVVLVFCAGTIVYLLVNGSDIRLHETIANGIFLLAGSTIGSYLFGKTWSDIKNGKNGKNNNNHGK